jgi:hypothetical protein
MPVSRVYLIFFLIVLGVGSFLAWMFSYNQFMFWSVLPEFVAGFLSGILGIILGFEINRRYELSQQQMRIEFTLKSLRDELQLNFGDVGILESRIQRGEECFMLFRTTTWKMFGNQLDSFKDFQFVLSLGYLYWEFDYLNEAMKKGSSAQDLKEFYAYHPPFNGIMDILESLRKLIISTISYIDKYFFTK